jgi:hypothetical protein
VGDLLSKEMRKTSSKETSTAKAMAVKGRSTEGGKDHKGTTRSKEGKGHKGKTRSNSKDSKAKAKCWFCGKSGHLQKDCWKRQEASKDDSTKEANSTTCMLDEVLSVYCVSPPVFTKKV